MRERITCVIMKAAREFNETSKHNPIELNETANLFGKDGVLDSLGLVSFIVLVEEGIEDEFDTILTLADEKAMSQKNSPFGSIAALTEYILQELEENQ